ncbi:MAG: FkbM family methyltransferase, partial [Planctomycetota bacterium]|nr:FkbM family methyltransferase [Planctomycetota bacterium]
RLRGRDAEAEAARARRRAMKERVVPWFAARGDETLRLDYPLTPTDAVIDLGGYEGQWAHDIYARYGCRVLVFEPVAAYAAAIDRRFADNDQVECFAFGLGAEDAQVGINLEDDATSIFKEGEATEMISIRRAEDFLDAQGLADVALIKINIEGAEYDLLDHVLDSGWIRKIENLQIQFHDFVEDAEARMRRIQERLQETHEITWQYPFVWENWKRREDAGSAS